MPVCIYCGEDTDHLVSEVVTCKLCEKDLEEGHKPPYKRKPTPPKPKAHGVGA